MIQKYTQLSDTHRNLVQYAIAKVFGVDNQSLIDEVFQHANWCEIPAGAVLFKEGEKHFDVFVLVSGRMVAVLDKPGSGREVLGEISRGETVGEMALLTGEPRSATVLAVRDSLLMQITHEAFEKLAKKHPQIVFNIARLIIQRLQRVNISQKVAYNVVNICLVPGSNGVDMNAFARQLHQFMSRYGNCLLLTAELVDQYLDQPGMARTSAEDTFSSQRLTMWLDQQEAQHDFLILVTDGHTSAWAKRCIRQADEILYICQADDTPSQRLKEMASHSSSLSTSKTLVLLQPPHTDLPSGTAAWLKNLNFKFHHHIKLGEKAGYERLARFLSGNPVGLVLSGGGAKGIAHIGVYRAMVEAGVPIDLVGGTSIGSVIGGLIALGKTPQEVHDMAREYFLNNPTPITDFNVLPIISLMRGRKMDHLLSRVFGQINIEDCWLNNFWISTNLTNTTPFIHRKGSLARAIRCSISLPGIFPPVVYQQCIHVDGGIFNNLPIDVIMALGVKKIAAVDLDVTQDEHLGIDQLPSTWQILLNRMYSRNSQHQIPSLMTTIMKSCMVSSDVQARKFRSEVGLYFNPDVSKVGLMDWKQYDETVKIGYEHACEVIEQWEGF